MIPSPSSSYNIRGNRYCHRSTLIIRLLCMLERFTTYFHELTVDIYFPLIECALLPSPLRPTLAYMSSRDLVAIERLPNSPAHTTLWRFAAVAVVVVRALSLRLSFWLWLWIQLQILTAGPNCYCGWVHQFIGFELYAEVAGGAELSWVELAGTRRHVWTRVVSHATFHETPAAIDLDVMFRRVE